MVQPNCPVCGQRVPVEENRALPFCSRRCREVDLGRWLGEAYLYSVPKDDESQELVDEEEG